MCRSLGVVLCFAVWYSLLIVGCLLMVVVCCAEFVFVLVRCLICVGCVVLLAVGFCSLCIVRRSWLVACCLVVCCSLCVVLRSLRSVCCLLYVWVVVVVRCVLRVVCCL